MTAMQWVFSFLRKYRKRLIFAMFLATITAVSATVNPQISGAIVDDVIMGGDREILPTLIIIMLVSTLFRTAIRFWFVMIFEKTSQEMIYTMRDYVFRKFMKQDFTFYNDNRTGDLMSRQTGDMDEIGRASCRERV